VTAALLLLAGGLAALQTMTLIAALPFCLVMIVLVFGLVRGLRADVARHQTQRSVGARPAVNLPWRLRLGHILHEPTEDEVKRFIGEVVEPALHEVATEMQAMGQEATVTRDDAGAAILTVTAENTRNFVYGVRPGRELTAAFSTSDLMGSERRRPYAWVARTEFSDGS